MSTWKCHFSDLSSWLSVTESMQMELDLLTLWLFPKCCIYQKKLEDELHISMGIDYRHAVSTQHLKSKHRQGTRILKRIWKRGVIEQFFIFLSLSNFKPWASRWTAGAKRHRGGIESGTRFPAQGSQSLLNSTGPLVWIDAQRKLVPPISCCQPGVCVCPISSSGFLLFAVCVSLPPGDTNCTGEETLLTNDWH